jgi:hypothetical protein
MRWPTLLIVKIAALGIATLMGAGCGKTVYRAYESQYCSSDDDEEPFRECAKSSDLVCINTYKMSYGGSSGMPPVVRDMWLCRLACDPTKAMACMPGEVCCPGPIFGRTYGFTHACVQPSYCAALDSIPRDGGARDATLDLGTGSTGNDAGADVPVEAGGATGDAGDARDAGDSGDAADASGDTSADGPDAV